MLSQSLNSGTVPTPSKLVREDGAPAVGSAFVVFADAEQSFLLTSFATV